MPRMETLDSHPLISQRCSMLEEDELAAHKLVAESLLKVQTLAVSTDADCAELDAAVVLQINYQVEAGVEGYMMQEARRGARHIVYRGRNRMHHVHRQSLEMVRGLRIKLGDL